MAEIIDALRRDGDSSNSVIGIVILVLLTVFVAPDVLPQLVANSIPFLDEGLPCTQVLNADDRANHQSWIGRGAIDPLTIRAEIGSVSNGTSPMVVRVLIINNTIGSVPFVFNPNQVIVGNDTTSSGVGLIFNPNIGANLDYDENGVANSRAAGLLTFPESDIKVLGPRQRCVHRVQIPANAVNNLPAGATVQAYYRIVIPTTRPQANPGQIFVDQGVWNISGGLIQSAPVQIPVRAAATTGQQ